MECLATIRSTEGIATGAVWRRGPPTEIATTRRDAYAALVARIEVDLEAADTFGLVFMDGDGSDHAYRSTHRKLKLSRRRVIEDAVHLDSRTSLLIQMADLVAWTANAHVDRHPGNAFAHDWYTSYLAERDPRRSPQPI